MKPTKDIFEIVTNRIIEKLETGFIPWKQPWTNLGLPRNLVTQRPYRGINHLLLGSLNYPSHEFLTFKQVQDLGGRIRKGEHGTLIVFWLWLDEEDQPHYSGSKQRKRPFLRYYYVFNVSQCTGIPERAQPLSFTPVAPLDRCEEILVNMPHRPKIVYEEDEAYYHIQEDFINLPKIEMFDTAENFYNCLFHELIHATGHENRLNRPELVKQARYGTKTYSIEELTAEIGACYLSSYAGIAVDEMQNSVSYIQGWLDRLKNDKKFVVYAAAHAQRAVDYILNISHVENELVDELTATHEI